MVRQDVEGPVNIGSGEAVSMMKLAQMVCEQAGYEPKFRTHPDKPIGTFYRCADITLMNEFYTPRIDLRTGIERALAGE